MPIGTFQSVAPSQRPARRWRFARLGSDASADVPISLADQAVVSASNFLLGALLARYLGLGEYGAFVLASTAVAFLSGIQQALIVTPFVTLWNTRNEEDRRPYELLVLLQQLVFAAVSTLAVVAGIAIWTSADARWGSVSRLSAPLACYAGVFLVQDFLRRLFFTRREFFKALAVDVVAYCGQLAAVVALGEMRSLSVEATFFASSIAFLVSASIGMSLAGTRLRGATLRTLARCSMEHWTHGRWLVGAALLQWVAGNYSLVAAGAVLGAAASGGIRAAQNIMGVTHLLFLALDNVLPSRMAAVLREGGKAALRRSFARALAGVGGVTLAIGVGAALAPGALMELVYGAHLRGYGFVLVWFAGLYQLVAAGTVLRFVLRAVLVSRPVFVTYAITSAFGLLLAFPLVRSLGLSGAMLGLLVSQIVACAYLAACVRKALA